jgi:hypothetical protein
MKVVGLLLVLGSLLTGSWGGAQGGELISLSGVKFIADRGPWGTALEVPEVADGKPETNWNSGAMDLRVSPANLFLRFPQPVAIGALEVDTVVSKGALRLTDLEVYAPVGEGWALLGEVKGNRETTIKVPLKPCRTDCLRLRLRDNLHVEHCWGVIAELRVLAPAAGVQPLTLAAAPVPQESVGEQRFVTAALGRAAAFPRAVYDPAKGYLYYVRAFVDTLLEKGTDRYGAVHSPLWISLLLLDTQEHPQSVMPTMPGQRIGDRAQFGGNLQHDLPLLEALPHLTRLTGEARYEQAARAYLKFFVANCTTTPTGLWPWGEHGHWDFFKDEAGHNTHEYLGAASFAFLDQAWAIKPEAVLGEARGLLNHIRDFETYMFCRHADFKVPLQDPRQADRKGLDFPRHGAMFLRHWAHAYSKTGDAKFLEYCDGMLKHFTLTRQPDGTLPALSQYSDRPALGPGLSNNLAVGICLLESVPLLGNTPTAARARQLGTELLAVVAAAPARPPRTGFAVNYGGGDFAGGAALLQVQAYRLTQEARHLEPARAFARAFAEVERTPTEGHIRAQVYGLLLNLYLDLAEVDKDPQWLAGAHQYARLGLEDLYHNGLLRGASNLGYYDSELYVSTFVYGLVRLQAAVSGVSGVPPLYFHR